MLTALIRVFFNRWHTGRRVWWIPAAAAVGVVALAIWLQPDDAGPNVSEPVSFDAGPGGHDAALRGVPLGRVGSARDPVRDAEQIEARADDIERQAVLTQRDAAGERDRMTEEERDLLGAWVASRR